MPPSGTQASFPSLPQGVAMGQLEGLTVPEDSCHRPLAPQGIDHGHHSNCHYRSKVAGGDHEEVSLCFQALELILLLEDVGCIYHQYKLRSNLPSAQRVRSPKLDRVEL